MRDMSTFLRSTKSIHEANHLLEDIGTNAPTPQYCRMGLRATSFVDAGANLIIGNAIVAGRRNTPVFTHFSPSDQRRVLGNANTIQGSSDRREFENSLGRLVVLEDRSPH